MALRKRKPTSPGRRFQTVSDFKEITKDKPERPLLAQATTPVAATTTAARPRATRAAATSSGTAIDFKRNKDGVPAKVAAVEYDPNRNCRILLLHYLDGEKRYILAPKDVKVGDTLQNGQGRRSARATACRCATSPSAPWCTPSSSTRAAAARWAAPPARRAAGGQGGRLRHPAPAQHRDAPRRSTAGPPSARSATPRPS